MKKLLMLLPISFLLLTGCKGNNNNSGSSGGGGGLPTGKEVVVTFYLDYNHAQDGDEFFKANWYYGRPIDLNSDEFKNSAGQKFHNPTDADANYPEFGTFVGWSMHPVIDDESQLWNFAVDTKGLDERGKYLTLYAIWQGNN